MLSKEALSRMTPEQFRALRRKAQAIPLQPRDGRALPASFAQQRLWFLSQLEATSDAYHIAQGSELRGGLDCAALRWSLDRLVARHESLRTRFESVDGVPYQRIEEGGAFVLLDHDLSDLDEASQQREAQTLQALEAQTPFDLERGPLFRGRLLRLAPERHVLLLTMHHIISDGWSMGVLSRELEALYSARAMGADDPLPTLPVQYADYAAWQRERLSPERVAEESGYWRQALSDAPAFLELPTDRKRPPEQDHRGALLEVALDASLAQAVKALSLKRGATLYMTLLAAWSVVLSRLSGQGEVVLGTPMANRNRSEVEGLIGFFVNTLAIRVRMEDDPTVSELIERVKSQVLSAQEHQELPFEQVVEAVNPTRSGGHAPIFQTMFAWQNNESGELRFAGLEATGLRSPHAVSKFDLTLSLSEEADGRIEGWIEYATSLFEEATVRRYAGYLERVLRGMTADAGMPVNRLPLLGEEEYRRVTRDWNATERDFGPWRPVHASVEDHAIGTPHAEAVSCGDEVLDYATLNAGANRLAHWLRGWGVEAQTRVAICVQRSVWAIEAVLGIMKSGGAYVPVDPAYPSERMAEMLSDARPALILTDAGSREALEAALSRMRTRPEVLEIDTDRGRWSEGSSENLSLEETGLTAEHIAYVIYTSGSTGRPKGVMSRHGGPTALMHALREPLALDARTRVLQFSSFSFDAFVLEWVMAFGAGGSLHLGEAGERLLGEALEDFATHRRITHAFLTPPVLSSMPESAMLASVRMIACGGEVVPPAFLRRWNHGRRFLNVYGPTETTGISITYACPVELQDIDSIPIGRPLANEHVYLLDHALQPVPIGATGELYIGGAGVARGYLDRPELTAERFIDSPFVAGERLYRTGDLGRWRGEGLIDYRGRNDFQVKIRGYRIELGEIEAKLTSLPGVKEAVVLVREDVRDEKRLVAYYLQDDAAETDADTLRSSLQSQLPEYMVPVAFVKMDAWPLTNNGKLDRKALPVPEADDRGDRAAYVPPCTPVEQTMAAIWAQLLGVERIGRNDNFFALGGHSLLGVRMISRVRKQMGLEIAPGALFASPTLAAFAAQARTPESDAIPLQPRDGRALPASFAQQRLWFLSQLEATSDAYHIAQGSELRGGLDCAALRWSLDRLVARHESLRTRFESVDGVPYQRIEEGGAFVLLDHDLSDLDEASQQREAQTLQALEAQTPFDLERGPLFRGRLLRLAPERHVLLLTMHHIISDGWSMGVLSRELEALYSARAMGADDPLPTLPVQYADYAAWQRERLSPERVAEESGYWRQALSDAPAFLELPTDRKRPPEQDHRGALLEVALDASLAQAVKALSLKRGATLYMTLLAAWSVVLSRLSGQGEVVLGTPMANRNRSEVEGLIGFFVNTLAIRVRMEDDPTVSELIERVKSQVLSAQEHQELPFEQVVEAVNPTRSGGHAPIFQTMFAWQNNESGELRFAGLEATGLRSPHAVSKFDLTLSLSEEADGRIEGWIEYATSLFEEATVRRYAGYLERVLRGMTADAGMPVNRLPLLGEEEYRRVTRDWNATERDFGPWRPVHASVEDHAIGTPHAEAVSCGDEVLDYATLNAGANRLAHWLRGWGVEAQTRVAICVQRSVWAIEAVLGIMKSGGAYVPVDPAYPSERMAEMLSDARPALILTDAGSREALEAALSRMRTRPEVLEIDTDRGRWSEGSSENLSLEETGLTAEHIAYVIYTSGSTGRPKGVMSRHGGPTALMHALREPLALDARTRVLQFSSFSFDAFVLEWVMAFGAGGSLHLGEAGERLLGEALEDFATHRRITHAFLTPPVLSSMPESAMLASVRMIACGGEVVPPAFLRRWNHGRRFLNVYGPTETTGISITYACPVELQDIDSIPIGRPLANEHVYLLDHALQPVPIGATGELYIGGAGVARGYLDRPELTAERFIDSPFVAGERLYRTGDLGRWRGEGLIDYRGRNDFQVKIRGYRIELGEIEAKLTSLPGVKEAVVLVREDVRDEKRLVAYYLQDDAAETDADTLRSSLQSQLPEYMVPVAFVKLDVWPLTSNAKLDRKALPAPDICDRSGRPYVAPRTPIEEVLAAIWIELLEVERVGVHDNFFDLGGHSLMAMRLMAAVRDTLGITLPLKTFFESPTIEHMGRSLLPDDAEGEEKAMEALLH